MVQSLSELAFLLFFLAVAVVVLLYSESRTVRAELAASEAARATLEEEVAFLQKILEEKEHGVVPCWRRPEGAIPRVAGGIVVHAAGEYELWNGTSGERRQVNTQTKSEEEQTEGYLTDALARLFGEERAYAGEQNCYLRLTVENRTGDYAPYEVATAAITDLGMVVAHE